MGNILTIGIGTTPNDTTGDPLRTAMTKVMTAVNGLAGNFNGTTAPTSVMPFQSWFDTSTTPATLRYFDGVSWVGAATLNQSTHVYGSLAAPTGSVSGDLTGTLPSPTIASLAVTNAKLAVGAASANIGSLTGDITGTLPSTTIAALAVTNAKMAVGAASANIGSLTGDLTGALPGSTIAKIQGVAVSGVTGTGNAVLSASPTHTGTLTSQGLFSASGGGGYLTTTIDARNNNTGGIQITGASTTQNQEITKSPLQVNWNPGFTGSPGGTFNTAAITAITTSTINDQIYPWGIIGIVNNHTDVLTTGNPNAVAINGTCFTYSVASSQASSSWGANFVIDTTNAAAVVNPTAYMIGVEIDGYYPTGSGTDANAKRIGLLIGCGPKTADLTVHVFAAIDISPGFGTTDNGITFSPQGGSGNITNLINAGLGSTHYTNFLTSNGFNVDNGGNIAAQTLQIQATANGSVATAMSSLGPAGSHTTVQEWFAIKNGSGVVRYVPGF